MIGKERNYIKGGFFLITHQILKLTSALMKASTETVIKAVNAFPGHSEYISTSVYG